MANILLGVTGSVAAIKTPLLRHALVQAGHVVKVVATNPALYFFDPAELPAGGLHVDADEWPGRSEGRIYQRGDPVLHIDLRRWADLFLIAPLDANTLAKLANGLCDNCLTCVWRAWDPARPVILAPAMNTFMWENPLTRRHFKQLLENQRIHGPEDAEGPWYLIEWLEGLNQRPLRLMIIPPLEKELACGDVGVGAMADVPQLVSAVDAMLTRVQASGPEKAEDILRFPTPDGSSTP